MTGLTSAQVAERHAAGQSNAVEDVTSRSLGDIVRSNTFTLFNLILGIALALVLMTGRWPDAVFGFVVIINAGIGIVTEYKAKRTLDKLAILDAPAARVMRDGSKVDVLLADIVLDDVVLLATGEQIPADGDVVESAGMEVDESLLTGESRPVRKRPGDEVFSGAFVVAGAGKYVVTRVGADGYANRVTIAAKRYSVVSSDLRDGVNKILRIVSVGIVPIALLLAWSQLQASGGLGQAFVNNNWKDAITAAVAGIVGLIPEGLVLLTSLNFAVAAMLLARQKVLVQELPAVEVLARVDVLCLDKTGTLTDGEIALEDLIEVAALPGARGALAALTGDPDGNATSRAIAAGLASGRTAREGVEDPDSVAHDAVPFSSVRKWSAVVTPSGAWVLGAPEFLLGRREDAAARDARAVIAEAAGRGARVLLLASAPGGLPDPDVGLDSDLVPALVAVLSEQIRPDAAETLAYFHAQGVCTKIISGDSPDTVAAVGARVGIAGPGAPVRMCDARDLPEGESEGEMAALTEMAHAHDVFGRVSPEQKVRIVKALQSRGHVVAMTGDGVNDAPALKEADLGIAMGSGSGATKAVARIVLVDGKFSTLPGVVAQGRRVMANMERVATLFLSKTTYAALLALTVVVMAWPFPFLPRHMTLVGSLAIGIPAFILALAPNPRRYMPGFLRRVLSFAIPVGLSTGIVVLVAFSIIRAQHTLADARTSATIVLLVIGLWVVGIVARPLRLWKVVLIGSLASAALAAFWIPALSAIFQLNRPQLSVGVFVAIAFGCVAVESAHRYVTPWLAARGGHDAPPACGDEASSSGAAPIPHA